MKSGRNFPSIADLARQRRPPTCTGKPNSQSHRLHVPNQLGPIPISAYNADTPRPASGLGASSSDHAPGGSIGRVGRAIRRSVRAVTATPTTPRLRAVSDPGPTPVAAAAEAPTRIGRGSVAPFPSPTKSHPLTLNHRVLAAIHGSPEAEHFAHQRVTGTLTVRASRHLTDLQCIGSRGPLRPRAPIHRNLI